MERQWKYLENQFETATRKSFRKALKLSNHHDAALLGAVNSDPVYQPIYDRYHPLHLAYVAQYGKWESLGGGQEGETQNVKQLLKTAMGKIDGWDVAIQVVYPKTTSRYTSIFPDGRKPFYEGGYIARIQAFNTLSLNIGADAALATVKADIDTTYNGLDAAKDDQTVAKGTVKIESGVLNLARIQTMNMQYRNMCWVNDNFFDERLIIVPALIDLELLRDIRQTHFTGTLSPSETKHIVKRTLLPDDELQLKSIGNGTLNFYLATTEGGTNSTAVVVNENSERIINAEDFGITEYSAHRFLTVVNQSISETVQFEVDVE